MSIVAVRPDPLIPDDKTFCLSHIIPRPVKGKSQQKFDDIYMGDRNA